MMRLSALALFALSACYEDDHPMSITAIGLDGYNIRVMHPENTAEWSAKILSGQGLWNTDPRRWPLQRKAIGEQAHCPIIAEASRDDPATGITSTKVRCP